MNIQNALLPLIENEDYQIVEDKLIALPKVRLVDQLLHHPEILEVTGEKMEEVDGLFNLNKNAVLILGVAAFDETIKVSQVYYEILPSLEEVKMSCIKDLALAVGEYLLDKQNLVDSENDNLNICNGRIVSFNFKNIPMPTAKELSVCYENAIAKESLKSIKAEALAYLVATDYKIIKSIELGTSVALDVLEARAAARLKLQ